MVSCKKQVLQIQQNFFFRQISPVFRQIVIFGCAPAKRKKKNSVRLNLLFMQSCSNLNFIVVYAIFPPNPNSLIFKIDKKSAYWWAATNKICYIFFRNKIPIIEMFPIYLLVENESFQCDTINLSLIASISDRGPIRQGQTNPFCRRITTGELCFRMITTGDFLL